MVTFVDDDLPILSDDIIDRSPTCQALDHRDVEAAFRAPLARAELADLSLIESEEQRELRAPLIHKRLPMNEDERVAATLRYEVAAHDRLAGTRRCDEGPHVMREDRLSRALLRRSQGPFEVECQRLAGDALVIDIERDGVLMKQGVEIGSAAAGQSDVFW